MEKIKKYQKAILELLQDMATDTEMSEAEHEEIITDTKNHHYFLQWIGFDDNQKFIDKPLIHLHIKANGKIWILANLTDEDIAQALVQKGILPSDLVIGFHPRHLRPHTGYAEA